MQKCKEAIKKMTIYQHEKKFPKKTVIPFLRNREGDCLELRTGCRTDGKNNHENGIAVKQTRVLKKMFSWLMPNEYDSVGGNGRRIAYFVNRKKK